MSVLNVTTSPDYGRDIGHIAAEKDGRTTYASSSVAWGGADDAIRYAASILGLNSTDSINYTGLLGNNTMQMLLNFFPNALTVNGTVLRTCVWQCEPGQTGYEIDGCGNRRENPACAYREASLYSCNWPQNLIVGQLYQLIITVNQGSKTENYKLIFTGDFVGESTPFTVNAGTGQQQFTVGNITFTTGGYKSVTATLVKV